MPITVGERASVHRTWRLQLWPATRFHAKAQIENKKEKKRDRSKSRPACLSVRVSNYRQWKAIGFLCFLLGALLEVAARLRAAPSPSGCQRRPMRAKRLKIRQARIWLQNNEHRASPVTTLRQATGVCDASRPCKPLSCCSQGATNNNSCRLKIDLVRLSE